MSTNVCPAASARTGRRMTVPSGEERGDGGEGLLALLECEGEAGEAARKKE